MGKGSRILDKELKELLAPLGFIKLPKCRDFFRLFGEGIFQRIKWVGNPHLSKQSILFEFRSIYDYKYAELIPTFMLHGYNLERFYDEKRGENSIIHFQNEDEEFSVLKDFLIDIMQCTDTQQKLYDFSRNNLPDINKYRFGFDLELSLYLKDFEESKRYIEEAIKYREDTIEFLLDDDRTLEERIRPKSAIKELKIAGQKKREMEREEIEHFKYVKSLLGFEEKIEEYLQNCKKDNLTVCSELIGNRSISVIEKYY